MNLNRRAALMMVMGVAAAHAQPVSDFPTRPIRLILGFPPAGSGDFIGRLIAEEMGKLLGQPVVVENRPGAATNIASEAVARAAPTATPCCWGAPSATA